MHTFSVKPVDDELSDAKRRRFGSANMRRYILRVTTHGGSYGSDYMPPSFAITKSFLKAVGTPYDKIDLKLVLVTGEAAYVLMQEAGGLDDHTMLAVCKRIEGALNQPTRLLYMLTETVTSNRIRRALLRQDRPKINPAVCDMSILGTELRSTSSNDDTHVPPRPDHKPATPHDNNEPPQGALE